MVKIFRRTPPIEEQFVTAASSNDLTRLTQIITECPSLLTQKNDPSDFCGLAMQKAASKGHVSIVKEILDRTSISDTRYFLAIDAAKSANHRNIVQLLDGRKTPSQAQFMRAMDFQAESYLEKKSSSNSSPQSPGSLNRRTPRPIELRIDTDFDSEPFESTLPSSSPRVSSVIAIALGVAALFWWHKKIIATFGRWG